MTKAWSVVAGSFVAGVLAGCGSKAMSGSTAVTPAQGGRSLRRPVAPQTPGLVHDGR